MNALAAADGASVVLVTHDAGQAKRCADRVVFLSAGRIVEDAPTAQFFSAPRSAAAQAFQAGRLHIEGPMTT